MILTPKLSAHKKEPIYIQLRDYIVDEIASERLVKNEKLPSVRRLASHLALSRNSIENAYNQLLAEGYIVSRERSGYYVAELEAASLRRDERVSGYIEATTVTTYPYDFKNEFVSRGNFDYKLWKKHLNYILNYNDQSLYGYGETRGEYELRDQIAKYFYRARGVIATPDNIVIGGGVSPLLSILVKLFDYEGLNVVGMEDPGFNKAKGIFEYSHMTVESVPVGSEGIKVNHLYKTDSRVCYVSPSHQFPTGYIMPINNRQKLLTWAMAVDGYIIEDDYNSELRFEGKPIPAMQGIDRDERVIYLGSFSTVLAPAIRVSFMVLPRKLNDLYNQYVNNFVQGASKLEQLALANLIKTGDFEKHIRRIRKNYAKKQEVVLGYMDAFLPEAVRLKYGRAGLQITIELPSYMDESAVVNGCKEKGVLIAGLSEYCLEGKTMDGKAMILSYRGIENERLSSGIMIIGNVIREYIILDLQ